MSGHVGDLSPTQERVLAEFRQALSAELKPAHDDYLLLQFLRARRFDLQKTLDMFRKHLRFREQYPEEYMVNEFKPPEILIKDLLPPVLGYDKAGSPVRIINAGHQDIKGLINSFRRPEIRKCLCWILDTDKRDMRIRSKETGIHIETRTFIADLDGLNLRQIYHRDIYDLVISCVKLYEGNYPENLKIAFVINAPPFFSWLFNMFKFLVTEDTVQKIRIYGSNGWKEEILKYIDADILPVAYGGTRTDPDGNPRCPSLIREYYQVPKSMYLRNQNRLYMSDENVLKVLVKRRSKYSIPINVEVPGSTVAWEVDCRDYDINAFLVYTEGPSSEIVIEKTIIRHDHGVGKGLYYAEKSGKYKLVLDNSHSLLRSKEVLYKVYVSTFTAKGEEILSAKENKGHLIAA